jgi:hypothetical protein
MPNYSSRKSWYSTLAVMLLLAATSNTSYSQTPPEQSSAVRRSIIASKLPAQGRVQFPNGEEILVTFRSSQLEPMTPVNLQQFSELLAAARRGDTRSQAIVGRTMVYCAGSRGVAFSTPNTQNLAAIRDRRNNRKETMREAEVREFCAKLPAEEIASGVEWLKSAATKGDVEARMSLPTWYRFGSDEQIEALMTSWQQGSVAALRKLSNAYLRRSRESGPESEDAINALAAAWLYTKLNESAFREQAGSDFVDAAGKELSQNLDQASPKVRDEAIATARKMLSQATNCCSFP